MNRQLIAALLLLIHLSTQAAEMSSDHSMHAMPSDATMADAVAEGVLAPTGVEITPAQRCALAARGVVMLDNAAWLACGGKPATVPQNVVPSSANPHAGH